MNRHSNRHTPRRKCKMRSKFWWLTDFAIRMTYRISLRSSSMWEPRHPLLKVFFILYTPNQILSEGYYCSSVTAHYNEFLIWCKANVILRVLRRTTFAHSKQGIKVPLFFLSGGQSCCRSTDWDGARWVACLVRGVNLRIQGLSVSWCFLQLGARVTLITSLSEFISVFKQPTSSVVFWFFNQSLVISTPYLQDVCFKQTY